MRCGPLSDQARGAAFRVVRDKVVQQRLEDLEKAGRASNKATVTGNLLPKLDYLAQLPTHILVRLAALPPAQLLTAVADLRAKTWLDRMQLTVRGVSATFLHAHACRDCPDTWSSGIGSDRPHRTFWQQLPSRRTSACML